MSYDFQINILQMQKHGWYGYCYTRGEPSSTTKKSHTIMNVILATVARVPDAGSTIALLAIAAVALLLVRRRAVAAH
jgi:hypothetical protein